MMKLNLLTVFFIIKILKLIIFKIDYDKIYTYIDKKVSMY